LRLVVLLNRKAPAQPRGMVLGSPDPELHGHQRVALDAARFQIEWLVRVSQPCTGLLDWQARAAAAFDVHGTASQATLHLVRAEDRGRQQGQAPHVCSRASGKQGHCHERWLDVLMEKLALDPTWVKNHACYGALSTYGAIAA